MLQNSTATLAGVNTDLILFLRFQFGQDSQVNYNATNSFFDRRNYHRYNNYILLRFLVYNNSKQYHLPGYFIRGQQGIMENN